MFEFDLTCKVFENLDPVEYSAIAIKKSADVLQGLKGLELDGLDAITVYNGLILGAILSDGKISDEEFVLVKPMVDLALGYDVTKKDLNKLVKYFKRDTKDYKDFVDAVVDLFGEISDELKDDIVTLCLIVCAVDGKISLKEKRWLKQLIK